MIYKKLTVDEFINEFGNSGQYANNFTREGLKALYNHIEDFYRSVLEEVYKLDVIAICCEYAEYESFDELIADYSQYTTLESIESETVVIETDSGGYVIRQF